MTLIGPDRYVSWRATPLGAMTEGLEHEVLFALIGPVSGMRVLDVGCGDGKFAARLAACGATVTAVDADPRMVAAARKTAPSASVIAADAHALPFAGERFDVVVANTLLCLVERRLDVLAEFFRILRPGGLLVLGELGRWSVWALARRIRGMLGSGLWRQARFADSRSLALELTKAGFSPAGMRGAVFYPPWEWAARLMLPVDSRLGRLTTFGAAYIAARAVRGEGP